MRFSNEVLTQMANALRVLSIDAIERAQSGHPGLPLGMADVAAVLFSEFLVHYPDQPLWTNRDRLILSAGHGAMLLYSYLHLTGYKDFSLEALQSFRSLHSVTAGHPEYGYTGIEVSTGPLGQGLATAVGMAIAEKKLSQTFPTLIDHYHYVVVGDGCLMEGVSHEAMSLAGHLKLNKLIVLFDDNGISIDGKTSLACSDNLEDRIRAYGWQYLHCDGHDYESIHTTIQTAKRNLHQPSFIACKTIIGYGAPTKQGTHKVHGSPLGNEEAIATKQHLGWKWTEAFMIPETIRALWQETIVPHKVTYEAWYQSYETYQNKSLFDSYIQKTIPETLTLVIEDFKKEISLKKTTKATREWGQDSIALLAQQIPQLIGGSADLTPSNLTQTETQQAITATNFSGRYLHFGIREFAMACIVNGLALHEGWIPYGATFFVFSDYCRSAIRTAALMGIRTIYVLTHDSIGVGEDGPTHQPVEHLSAWRAMPNVYVFRPCDGVETIETWQVALSLQAPSLLCLSRQKTPTLRTIHNVDNQVEKGAYLLHSFFAEEAQATLSIWATGTEVALAMEVGKILSAAHYNVHIISMPCWELFFATDHTYQQELLYLSPYVFAIEAGIAMGWEAIIRERGIFFGVPHFGVSAPSTAVYEHFGLTPDKIAQQMHHFIMQKENITDNS